VWLGRRFGGRGLLSCMLNSLAMVIESARLRVRVGRWDDREESWRNLVAMLGDCGASRKRCVIV
jgi:hypothetical protein